MSRKKETKQEANNNLHECNAKRYPLIPKGASLKEIALSDEEIVMIWDFFVSHAPVKKDKTVNSNDFGLRFLGDYGWNGNADHTALERALIKPAGLGHFVMVRADTIKDTLRSMNLTDSICWEHPRAVLKQNYNVAVKEDGAVNITNAETRMVCLFRHIRNAMAHNRIYYSDDGNSILLEDGDNNEITARILIPTHTLVDWIKIVDRNQKFYYKAKETAPEEKRTEEAS